MAELNYANYSYPNTPFVFDKIYEEAFYYVREGGQGEKDALGGPCIEENEEIKFLSEIDGVFVTRYILIEEYTNSKKEKEYAVVFQKRIDGIWSKQPYYKKIVALDYSTKVNEQLSNIFNNYTEEGLLVWNDLDIQQEVTNS